MIQAYSTPCISSLHVCSVCSGGISQISSGHMLFFISTAVSYDFASHTSQVFWWLLCCSFFPFFSFWTLSCFFFLLLPPFFCHIPLKLFWLFPQEITSEIGTSGMNHFFHDKYMKKINNSFKKMYLKGLVILILCVCVCVCICTFILTSVTYP